MRGRALLALGCAVLPGAAGAEGQPFARTSLAPRSVTVGQPVTLTVEVFVPTYFTGAPRFPPLEVRDAVVIFQDEGINLNETVSGQSYAGQQRSYLIYPQRPGAFEVPPFTVKVRFAQEGAASPRVPVEAKGGRFEASIPAAARGLDHFVATPSFELQETTDRALSGLKVGDSLTRTITMTATDAFAMMLPPLIFAPVDGLRVYPAQPKVSDRPAERDAVRTAKRVESATYLLEKAGTYQLPAIDIGWWDTVNRSLRHATLPEVTLSVAANPALAAEIPLPEEAGKAAPPRDPWAPAREALRRYGPTGVGLLAVTVVLVRLLRRPWRAWRGRRAARRAVQEESASAYLDHLRKTARSGHAGETLAAAYRWLDRRAQTAGAGAARLERFAQGSGDPQLPALAKALVETALAAPEVAAPETTERFAAAALRAERRHPAGAPPPGALGPLNPV